MPTIPLRQRSSTEIVDASFQIFRREPAQFVLATALIYVPWLLVEFALGFASGTPAVMSVFAMLFITIGGVVVNALVGGVVTTLASDVYLGQPTDIARSFRTTMSQLGALIVANFISWFLIVFGMIFLIIPGLYFLSRVFAAVQVVVIERASAGKALSRSSLLSDGNKLHILSTLLLIFLLLVAVFAGVSFLGKMMPTAIQLTLTTAMSAIIYPLFGITQTLLYYDTRIRKEGFDVEYLASDAWRDAAGVAPAPSA
jgi:hypothetical protein